VGRPLISVPVQADGTVVDGCRLEKDYANAVLFPVLFPVLVSPGSDRLVSPRRPYLSRFKGPSGDHADSDLRAYLTWCLERGVDPLEVSRPQVELYVRWMQEIRRFDSSRPPSAGACR